MGVIGRRPQLQRIEEMIEAARRGRAGALVITGEAGIGKTSLLDEAEVAAAGFQRLRASGVESESAIGHAGLLQLLGPLRDHLDGIPERQRRAVEAAVDWGEPQDADDRYLVAAGTMLLLARAAEERPVFVVVDDFHWLDPESAAAVLFAARRLTHDPVAFLLATRSGSPAGTSLDGIDALALMGLTPADSVDLFPPGTDPNVINRLVAATHGNPLALIEIVKRLSPAQRRGAAELADPLPTGERLQAVYEPVVSGLPSPCRRAVLLAAAATDDSVDAVFAALRAQGLDPDDVLGDAERRGVLVIEPGLVRFRHPLMRSAAWATATRQERRAAHTALAAALTDGRRRARTWHRAEAATGPDGDLAAQLEAIAEEDRARVGHAAASALFERASRLSEDRMLSAERLAAAVEDAALAGDISRASALAAQLLASDADHRSRGRALAALGILEQCTGSIPRAAQLFAEAARQLDGLLRVQVLAELAMEHHRLGDYAGVAAVAAEMDLVADRNDPHQRLLNDFFGGVAALNAGDGEHGRCLLTSAFESYRSEPSLGDEPRYLVLALLAAYALGLTPDLVGFFEGRLANSRTRGALAVLVRTLAMFAHGRAFFGDHTGAFADAGEAAELAAELGFVADAAPAVEMLAWQHAARGAHDEASIELERAADLVERAGTASVAAHLALARAFCALCRDDLDSVVALLEPRVAADEGRGALGEVLGVAPLLIEAYVALDRRVDATRLADRFAAVPAPDGRTKALIARCRGLAVEDDEIAVAAFETALTAHAEAMDEPFEVARTELLLGARLRRSGQRIAAREHLRTARDRFASMDLALWVKRATAELAGTGETLRPRGHIIDEPLTSQETRVALLVGRGMTNREVAAALFLSPKTVEHHLSSVYRKRGLRSRTELARAIAGEPDAAP